MNALEEAKRAAGATVRAGRWVIGGDDDEAKPRRSRKLQALRWYTVAVLATVGGGHLLGLDEDLVRLVVEKLTWALGLTVGANALGDHAAGAVAKVGEAITEIVAGGRRGRGE